jgi:hypothetical protein
VRRAVGRSALSIYATWAFGGRLTALKRQAVSACALACPCKEFEPEARAGQVSFAPPFTATNASPVEISSLRGRSDDTARDAWRGKRWIECRKSIHARGSFLVEHTMGFGMRCVMRCVHFGEKL